MVQGRTGYVVLAGLAIVAFHMFFGWRGMVAAIVGISVTYFRLPIKSRHRSMNGSTLSPPVSHNGTPGGYG